MRFRSQKGRIWAGPLFGFPRSSVASIFRQYLRRVYIYLHSTTEQNNNCRTPGWILQPHLTDSFGAKGKKVQKLSQVAKISNFWDKFEPRNTKSKKGKKQVKVTFFGATSHLVSPDVWFSLVGTCKVPSKPYGPVSRNWKLSKKTSAGKKRQKKLSLKQWYSEINFILSFQMRGNVRKKIFAPRQVP